MLALMVKRTKRSGSLLCTNCLAQLKMNPLTSDCLLCTFGCKGKENKKNPDSRGAGAKASTSLSRATFFLLFKNSHAKRPGSQRWQDAGEREKTERGDKTKHKNSNICSRFQPDSLMWITQHFVPWPWRTKAGWGDASRAERDALGGERPESTPARFAELELLSPGQGREVPPGHPGTACHLDCHSFSTKMAARQMKQSGAAGIKCHFQTGALLESSHATRMKIRFRQITTEVPFTEMSKCRDKWVRKEGVDEYLSILSEGR